MKAYIIYLFPLVMLLVSCNENAKENNKKVMNQLEKVATKKSDIHSFTAPMYKGHQTEEFLKQQVFQFEIDLNFGGNDRLDGTLYTSTNSSGIRIDKTDGSSLVFDGQQVYLTPAEANEKGARFDMFTWQYFFALPYKLNDPGTQWEDLGTLKLSDSLELPAGKLSFESGTGDAPDDWYVVYFSPENGLIQTAGYIVTFGGRDPKQAEANAHAICYHDYQDIAGIPVATRWTFHNWNKESGLGEQLGEATLSNLKFIRLQDSIFTKPENAKAINM